MTENNALTQKDKTDQVAPETTRGGTHFTPRVDIFETADELVLLGDIPGVQPEDVDLRFERGELILHGKLNVRHPGETFLLEEYDEGDFYRVFSIHESIDASRISAECKNGVLTVHLPKVEAAKPKQIKINAG
jgi:HSP20 family protein